MAKRGIRFKVFEGLDHQFYVHLIAGNNEIVVASEGHTREVSAHKAVDAVWRGVSFALGLGWPHSIPPTYTRDSLLPAWMEAVIAPNPLYNDLPFKAAPAKGLRYERDKAMPKPKR